MFSLLSNFMVHFVHTMNNLLSSSPPFSVGATAAICFRESGDTLGMDSEHDIEEEEREKPYMKRPLSAWRVWQ